MFYFFIAHLFLVYIGFGMTQKFPVPNYDEYFPSTAVIEEIVQTSNDNISIVNTTTELSTVTTEELSYLSTDDIKLFNNTEETSTVTTINDTTITNYSVIANNETSNGDINNYRRLFNQNSILYNNTVLKDNEISTTTKLTADHVKVDKHNDDAENIKSFRKMFNQDSLSIYLFTNDENSNTKNNPILPEINESSGYDDLIEKGTEKSRVDRSTEILTESTIRNEQDIKINKTEDESHHDFNNKDDDINEEIINPNKDMKSEPESSYGPISLGSDEKTALSRINNFYRRSHNHRNVDKTSRRGRKKANTNRILSNKYIGNKPKNKHRKKFTTTTEYSRVLLRKEEKEAIRKRIKKFGRAHYYNRRVIKDSMSLEDNSEIENQSKSENKVILHKKNDEVAILKLDKRPFPVFQLPKSRRQYMRSVSESDSEDSSSCSSKEN